METQEDTKSRLDQRIHELEREINRLQPIERTWFQTVVREKRHQLERILHQRELLGD